MKKSRTPRRLAAAMFPAGLTALVIGFGVYFDHFAGAPAAVSDTVAALHADLARENASPEVRRVAQWAVSSQDPGGLPFLVVDKARARLFAFDPHGRLRASTPVVLDTRRGDAPSAPAAPAGRFVADGWLSAPAGSLVWVNAQASLSLHSLPPDRVAGQGAERALHVAGDFYRDYLVPLKSQGSVAYVVPDFTPLHEVVSNDAWDDAPWDFARSTRLAAASKPF
ncbi:MAG TPA: hypothetical protein VLJ57_23550 [Burkholderiaceae bacterium]|nr:hypothetical protein [Burkholderiaceae bacterium]